MAIQFGEVVEGILPAQLAVRNTNTQPLNGSCLSTSLHKRAKPSMPRRKSAGSMAAYNPHLRRDLDHDAGFQKLRQSAAKSGGAATFR